MLIYYKAVLENFNEDKFFIDSLINSQIIWEKFRKSNYNAVYTHWRDGSIRGITTLQSDLRVIQQRTHELWESYLTHESQYPILPEPSFDQISFEE
jgi:uncharacterized protein YecT (DUF1311 family)